MRAKCLHYHKSIKTEPPTRRRSAAGEICHLSLVGTSEDSISHAVLQARPGLFYIPGGTMPAPYARAGVFEVPFFHHVPRRYAVVHTDQNRPFDPQHRRIAIAHIAYRCHSPLDSDASSIATRYAHTIRYQQRNLWDFGQFDLRHDLADSKLHRYVRIPFDYRVDQCRRPPSEANRIVLIGLNRNAAFHLSHIGAEINSNLALSPRTNQG
jgi:hypothetical protein